MFRNLLRRAEVWFTAPGCPVPLAWFRIAVALFCLLNTFIVHNYILDLYGQYGYVQWAITRATLFSGLPHIGDIALALKPFGISADQTVYILLAVWLFALVGLLAGIYTRSMAVLAWCIHYLWMHAGGGLVYGMDIFTHIALLYTMLMPCGDALSLDVVLGRRKSEPSVAAGVTRRMLQLHVAIVYTSSGLEKAAGIQWWNGEAIWRSLMLPVFNQYNFGWLAHVPWLAMAIGWSVIVIETGYGLAVWFRATRAIWIGLAIAMHLGIGLFLGMWTFAAIMIILNLGAFVHELTRQLAAGIRFESFSSLAALQLNKRQ